MKRFNYDEKVAITSEADGSIHLWTVDGQGMSQVFVDKKGQKAILRSDEGQWWAVYKQEAPYCFYRQLWFGEFPYGSWSWAIRQCKATGEIKVSFIDTDINPSGLSSSDKWERDCKAYVPEPATVTGKSAMSVV